MGSTLLPCRTLSVGLFLLSQNNLQTCNEMLETATKRVAPCPIVIEAQPRNVENVGVARTRRLSHKDCSIHDSGGGAAAACFAGAPKLRVPSRQPHRHRHLPPEKQMHQCRAFPQCARTCMIRQACTSPFSSGSRSRPVSASLLHQGWTACALHQAWVVAASVVATGLAKAILYSIHVASATPEVAKTHSPSRGPALGSTLPHWCPQTRSKMECPGRNPAATALAKAPWLVTALGLPLYPHQKADEALLPPVISVSV